jgi:hypothetical protein
MAEHCRLCTTNDRDGLVEELAEALWDSCRQLEMDLSSRPPGGPIS